VAAIQLSPLEIASGLVLGEGRAKSELARRPVRTTPRAALERTLLPLLRQPPCVVSFSGGRDSSALLAVAADVAHREGLSPPVPATLRFRGDPGSEESQWQEGVIEELEIKEWLRIEVGDELGVLGPIARGAITRHGLLWPPNVHTLVPLLEAARGGSLITGLGGDEFFGGRPRLRRVLLPSRVRRARARRRISIDQAWLRTPARSALSSVLVAEEGSKPVRWRNLVLWVAGRRQFDVLVESGDALAREAGTELAHPMLDSGFLAALAKSAQRPQRAARSATLNEVLGGLLPEAALARTDKADFTMALWGDEPSEFAADWSGDGLRDELVDTERLREAWAAERPDFRSATALQAAWLAEGSSGSLRRAGERLGAGAGIQR
jgi:asparagine synthase (glutamine-hydrolysing)